MKLPIGFRFCPTDEELVVHYLKRKVMSQPLPASVIPEIHAFNFDPWSLPGDLKEKRYCFWKRKGSKCSKVVHTSTGFWKVISKGKKILSSRVENDVVGTRKTWRFYQVKSQVHGHYWSKSRWLMHEFQMVDSKKNETNEVGDWVVFRVFQSKMKQKTHQIMSVSKCKCCDNKEVMQWKMGNDSPNAFDFKVDNNSELLGPPQPSSPCSNTD